MSEKRSKQTHKNVKFKQNNHIKASLLWLKSSSWLYWWCRYDRLDLWSRNIHKMIVRRQPLIASVHIIIIPIIPSVIIVIIIEPKSIIPILRVIIIIFTIAAIGLESLFDISVKLE